MLIREASVDDLDQILTLFEETIKSVNSKDYTEDQIRVWSAAKNRTVWLQKIEEQSFYVATKGDQIVGFGSIDVEGYLDFMYVHHQFQNQGIAKALLEKIESKALEDHITRIWSSVSITAQPFFAKNGYSHYQDEHKNVNGVAFTNALMQKMIN